VSKLEHPVGITPGSATGSKLDGAIVCSVIIEASGSEVQALGLWSILNAISVHNIITTQRQAALNKMFPLFT